MLSVDFCVEFMGSHGHFVVLYEYKLSPNLYDIHGIHPPRRLSSFP